MKTSLFWILIGFLFAGLIVTFHFLSLGFMVDDACLFRGLGCGAVLLAVIGRVLSLEHKRLSKGRYFYPLRSSLFVFS